MFELFLLVAFVIAGVSLSLVALKASSALWPLIGPAYIKAMISMDERVSSM